MDPLQDFPIYEIAPTALPQLAELPQPPKRLFVRGSLQSIAGKKIVAFVGSRACTSYGKQICKALIEGLRGYPIVVVSGLAIGIDAIAHEAALEAELTTVAFPGSGLSARSLYPAQHLSLAERILRAGGVLVSEYKPMTRAAPWMFPNRNRLMAGSADLIIVVEAEEQSGTLITARLGTEYNRIVGAVPGLVTSPTSRGSNWLLKQGAVPITDADDILRELNLVPAAKTTLPVLEGMSDDELRVLAALSEPKSRDTIIAELSLSAADAQIVFSILEIKGAIRETFGLIEKISR